MFAIDVMTKTGEIRTNPATGDRYIFNGTAWVAYTPAVTNAKLAVDAVDTDNIVDAAVTAPKLAA